MAGSGIDRRDEMGWSLFLEAYYICFLCFCHFRMLSVKIKKRNIERIPEKTGKFKMGQSVAGSGKKSFVNLCQKLLFLHQLTHNMTTDCSLNYMFNTWEFQAQTWGEHSVYRNCFWQSEQFLYTTCSPHVLQKEELLTKIYL